MINILSLTTKKYYRVTDLEAMRLLLISDLHSQSLITIFRCLYRRCPPLPIPNREVKPARADGTAVIRGRVGRCQILYKPCELKLTGFCVLYLFTERLNTPFLYEHPSRCHTATYPKPPNTPNIHLIVNHILTLLF